MERNWIFNLTKYPKKGLKMKIRNLILTISIFLCNVVFANDSSVKKALVKVYTAHQMHNYMSPWQNGQDFSSTATGFIIDGNRIITNAHAVLNEKFLQVRKEGDSKKYKANVKFVSEEYDLALIDVEDKSFFNGTAALKLGKLPNIQDSLTVYGYPLGGDKLSTTRGIVSRMEHNSYTLTNEKFLIGQTDAAINSGNSGGPVLSGGKVVGVAFAGLTQADNIGYFIPVNILENFLDDIKDGNYDGPPKLGLQWAKLESASQRQMLGLKNDSKGVFIKKIFPNSPFNGVLQRNDVLLKLDGRDIESDGTVEFRKNEKTDFNFINQEKKYGQTLSYEIVRDKKVQKGQVTLKKADIKFSVVKSTKLQEAPSYYVYGGLIFEPLTTNYITSFTEEHPTSTLSAIYDREDLFKDYNGLVILVRVLPFDVNLGYSELENRIITKVNGEKYKDFNDFVKKVRSINKEFIVFEDEDGNEIVLDVAKVNAQKTALMENYNILHEMSSDIR